MQQILDNFLSLVERHLPWLSIVFLFIGVFWADQSSDFAYYISGLMENFIDHYSYVAPIAIYLILTPTLIKLFSSESGSKGFAGYTIRWFAMARLLACLYAVAFTALIFGLPFYSSNTSFTQAFIESIHSLGQMLITSVYFYAVYAAIATVIVALMIKPLAKTLSHGVDLVEYLGRFIVPIIPFMMLGIGAYVTILPEVITNEIGADVAAEQFGTVTILWMDFDITSSLGMILIYILGALMTGIACGFWHAGLLALTKKHMPSFSIRQYFSEYWIKVYPLLWATSSEALATPLNLYMVKKFCPDIRDEVRQFVVGTGSFLNINGTIINVFLMTGLVAQIIGVEISVLQLLLSIPIVFLIAYGIPGIPGELVIFGGPMMLCMGIAPELAPIFISLYVGLQIGLPDSFRTASNSTDECLCAIILDKKY
ncbi:cation:dicarboxylase symporter family transporter [Candidatus Albibeggiatoa sp. nov. NOAA]|uniref:cation:dicarboxylate symporter family transporter n=1 Tax=Candidatus Albibeggiatoa sp. nov. NOAA TaxID=3162724 RepID=UPI0032FA48CB|nr:dicarboxylate/amino acid:cation symporter [Thiotrichaceae bacterium]